MMQSTFILEFDSSLLIQAGALELALVEKSPLTPLSKRGGLAMYVGFPLSVDSLLAGRFSWS
jgi:hypothetical protein